MTSNRDYAGLSNLVSPPSDCVNHMYRACEPMRHRLGVGQLDSTSDMSRQHSLNAVRSILLQQRSVEPPSHVSTLTEAAALARSSHEMTSRLLAREHQALIQLQLWKSLVGESSVPRVDVTPNVQRYMQGQDLQRSQHLQTRGEVGHVTLPALPHGYSLTGQRALFGQEAGQRVDMPTERDWMSNIGSTNPMEQNGGHHRPPSNVRSNGGIPRSLPALLSSPSDELVLNEHQIFLRSQIQVFCATKEDVATHLRGRNRPIHLGQVGIRCRHCSHVPVKSRVPGAVYFPASTLGLYQAAQNMSSNHIQCGKCSEMPNSLKQHFALLIPSKRTSSIGGRAYWAESATKMGLVDTEQGIIFAPRTEKDATIST